MNEIKEKIKKLAEHDVVRFDVEQFRKIAEQNTVFEEIMDWFETEFAEEYNTEIKSDDLIEFNLTENGIRYYYGREPKFLDAPVGEEGWDEVQWDEETLKELFDGVKMSQKTFMLQDVLGNNIKVRKGAKFTENEIKHLSARSGGKKLEQYER